MFENYSAKKKDFEAIESGIRSVHNPKLNFIFFEPKVLNSTLIVSYDKNNAYVWNIKGKLTHKIPHQTSIKDKYQDSWSLGVQQPSIYSLLRNTITDFYNYPRTSGGLLEPFTKLQKQKKALNNCYTTKESYLATILHELAHIYYNAHVKPWYLNKKENLKNIRIAQELYRQKPLESTIKLRLSTGMDLSELFAYCAEYAASEILWPSHKKNLDNLALELLNKQERDEEKIEDYYEEDSTLDKNSYHFAHTFGKILLTKHPNSWPEVLIEQARVCL